MFDFLMNPLRSVSDWMQAGFECIDNALLAGLTVDDTLGFGMWSKASSVD